MAIRVTLSNKSQPRNSQAAGDSAKLVLSRAIYQRLGSLVNNRTILADYNAGELPVEFVSFLDEMDAILSGTQTTTPSSEIVLTDEFLGNLGITQEYAYSKDVVNIPLWMDIDNDQSPMRVLVDTTDNTFLTYNGTEVLVRVI